MTAEGDEHIAVPSSYLTSTNISNTTQVRINAQPLLPLPSATGHQYQQQVRLRCSNETGLVFLAYVESEFGFKFQMFQPNNVTKLVSTANSVMTRNMNVLSSYGPQTNESLASTASRTDTSQVIDFDLIE